MSQQIRQRGVRLQADISCHTLHLQLLGMPLAHPTSTTTSLNFGSEPFLVVKFMTADPGEAFADFNHRTEHPRQTNWGQRGDREHRMELIFDKDSAGRLADFLTEYLKDSGRP